MGGGVLTVYGTLGTAAMIVGIAMIATEGTELVVLSILFFGAMGFGTAIIAATGFAILLHGKSHKSKKWEYKAITSLAAS